MTTKRGRLAIIVVVALAVSAAVNIFGAVIDRRAEREAQSFATRAEAVLGRYDRADLDEVLAQDAVSNWGGEKSPLTVDGHLPETTAEVRRGVVARYRIQSSGTDRCVDALWPDTGSFSVEVNGCEGYSRPLDSE